MEIKYFMTLKLWNRYFTLRTSAFDENMKRMRLSKTGFALPKELIRSFIRSVCRA